ncbi:phospholipase A2 inhibitor and Ly6/PLAUR domain-containing protein-like [Heteronotia binoei]|uniref:phospholipase A2 inhibitor and Ly6/PLAUR domain-containing protein-like n=1 Tax=Heteronotia binoei TaxID=13085 RepID=UPI00292F62D0|nr:phospholipase A2 inhibitor and Ly6/PLAUR domain-containing protein-like [Heteronotia binoei]
MHTLLAVCLLAAVVDLGLSLTCEICGGIGNTCNGSLEFCPPGEDKCGIVLLEGTGELQLRSIAKTCVPLNSCDEPFTSVSIGKAGGARTYLTCCTGDECRNITPTLPPLNTTANGKTCPACYSMNSLACEEEIIKCTGDQFYCLKKSGSITLGGRKVPVIIKGCANNAYCNNIQEHPFFDGIHNVITANCTLTSGIAGIVPGPFVLFPQILVGLLICQSTGMIS